MRNKHIIFAVHGIHTGSENWTDDFRRWANGKNPDISIEEFDYGKVYAPEMYLKAIIGPLGGRQQDTFASWIKEVLRCYAKDTPYSIVAHSWGTWIAHGMLARNKWVKPKAVTIIGSVLSEHFTKTSFPLIFRREQIEKLLVLWSPKDDVIQHFSDWPYGKCGFKGFVDGITFQNVVQVKTRETHSEYFTKMKREKYFNEIIDFCVR